MDIYVSAVGQVIKSKPKGTVKGFSIGFDIDINGNEYDGIDCRRYRMDREEFQ